MEPAEQRISDQERQQVAEVLRQAAGEGRIDLDELEKRLEAALAAKTYAEIVPITADLPKASISGLPVHRSGALLAGPTHESSFAMMSTTRRRGPWRVGTQHRAFALMGGVVLDLREAMDAGQEVTIDASVVMGSVDVLVDEHTVVICDGWAFMGDYSKSRSGIQAQPEPDSPVVRVRGRALMGRVNVRRRPGSAPPPHLRH
jgi:Domain of unknown function (DUF1707)